MLRRITRAIAAGVVLLAGSAAASYAQQPYGGYYNYVAQPGHPAALYPSPIYTPPIAGRTYITYAPLMPHEFLYAHSRTYRQRKPACEGGGYTEISIRYGYCPRHNEVSPIHPHPATPLPCKF